MNPIISFFDAIFAALTGDSRGKSGAQSPTGAQAETPQTGKLLKTPAFPITKLSQFRGKEVFEGEQVRQLQQLMKDFGTYYGPVDGKSNKEMKKAYAAMILELCPPTGALKEMLTGIGAVLGGIVITVGTFGTASPAGIPIAVSGVVAYANGATKSQDRIKAVTKLIAVASAPNTFQKLFIKK